MYVVPFLGLVLGLGLGLGLWPAGLRFVCANGKQKYSDQYT
jgi:hypothetical protein